MPNRHEERENVRLYLLGTLDESMANAVEDRYFTDPAYLRYLETAEMELIQDYLGEKLSTVEQACFEKRYLSVTELREKVERLRVGRMPLGRPRYTFAWAATCAAVVITSLWWFVRPQPAALLLFPGVYKSTGVVSGELNRGSGDAQLLLDLPGEAPSKLQARVSFVGPDGSQQPVWTSGPLSPVIVSASSTRFPVTIPSRLLRAGDYVVQLVGPDSNVIESYLLRMKEQP